MTFDKDTLKPMASKKDKIFYCQYKMNFSEV